MLIKMALAVSEMDGLVTFKEMVMPVAQLDVDSIWSGTVQERGVEEEEGRRRRGRRRRRREEELMGGGGGEGEEEKRELGSKEEKGLYGEGRRGRTHFGKWRRER